MKVKALVLRLLRFYQRSISPYTPPRCRYYPTCSNYAIQAVEERGVCIGGLLALRRFLRCNILFPGGYDPVPKKKK